MAQTDTFFQFRMKCTQCGWNGADEEALQRESKPYHGCPQCKLWWKGTRGAGGEKHSALRGYAIHPPCGKWHQRDSECKLEVKCEHATENRVLGKGP